MRLGIIGAGPGGYTAALAAAQKGIDTVLIEKSDVGGTCLNRGCIPTKSFLASAHTLEKIKKSISYGVTTGNITIDMNSIVERKNSVVQTLRSSIETLIAKKNIHLIRSSGRILAPDLISTGDEKIKCDAIIIATGTEPLKLWDDPSVIDSTMALDLSKIPETLLVAGAGALGVEFACFFASLGTRVTIAEMSDRILPSMDRDITDTLARELKKKGISIKTKTAIESVNCGEAVFHGGKSAKFDKILSAVGRKVNTDFIGLENTRVELDRGRIKTDMHMETAEKGIYAIGDAAAGFPMFAHVASAQALIAVRNIVGEDCLFDGSAIPSCVYSSPEVASVGIMEEQSDNPETSKIPFRVLGRAHAEGAIAGLIKIVAEDGIVKGVHIVGERAADLITEGTIAVSENMALKKLSSIIRAHPSFGEVYSEAYNAMEGISIYG